MQADKLKKVRAEKALTDVVQCPHVLNEEPAKRLKDLFIVA